MSLLEKFGSSMTNYRPNTRKAHVTDVCIFSLLKFTSDWRFSPAFDPIAATVLQEFVSTSYTTRLLPAPADDIKALLPSPKYSRALERHIPPLDQIPLLKRSKGKTEMRLIHFPSQTNKIKVDLNPKVFNLASIPYTYYEPLITDQEHAPHFFDDLLDKEGIYTIFGIFEKDLNHAPATRARRMISLKIFQQFLLNNGYLKTEPLRGIKTPKVRRNLQPVLSSSQTDRMLKMARPIYDSNRPPTHNFPLRDRAIMEILYGVGLRVSELTNLKLEDISLENKSIHLKDTKTDDSTYSPIPRKTLEYVSKYLEHREVIYPQDRPLPDFLFLNRYGRGPLDRNSIVKILKKYAKKTGIKISVAPHTLRRSAATDMDRSGARPHSIKNWLRHKDIRSVEYYINLGAKEVADSVRKHHPRG
jgi:integrase/recombinase XerD